MEQLHQYSEPYNKCPSGRIKVHFMLSQTIHTMSTAEQQTNKMKTMQR